MSSEISETFEFGLLAALRMSSYISGSRDEARSRFELLFQMSLRSVQVCWLKHENDESESQASLAQSAEQLTLNQ